jgi:hypothetical protein
VDLGVPFTVARETCDAQGVERRLLLGTGMRVLVMMLLVACGDDGSTADGGRAATDGGRDAGLADARVADASAGDAGGRDYRLDCDPAATELVLEASSAGVATMRSLGDAEPVGPDEVGDGQHHLFVGVADEGVTVSSECGDQTFLVMLHDATGDRVDGGYRITAEPIVGETIVYDQYGMETPTYVRADDRTEYLYYCGLYQSYACRDTTGVKGKLLALRRVDGGAWERVMHDPAPFAGASTSQCEPELAFDPESGLYHLFFIADDGADGGGLYVRSSADPEMFPAPASGEDELVAPFAARPTVAFDPYDEVWRFTFDAYDGDEIVQSWSPTIHPGTIEEIQARSELVHHSLHDLHPDVHTNTTNSVLQGANAVFPNADEVLFFYSGIGTAGTLRVFSQSCTRR